MIFQPENPVSARGGAKDRKKRRRENSSRGGPQYFGITGEAGRRSTKAKSVRSHAAIHSPLSHLSSLFLSAPESSFLLSFFPRAPISHFTMDAVRTEITNDIGSDRPQYRIRYVTPAPQANWIRNRPRSSRLLCPPPVSPSLRGQR